MAARMLRGNFNKTKVAAAVVMMSPAFKQIGSKEKAFSFLITRRSLKQDQCSLWPSRFIYNLFAQPIFIFISLQYILMNSEILRFCYLYSLTTSILLSFHDLFVGWFIIKCVRHAFSFLSVSLFFAGLRCVQITPLLTPPLFLSQHFFPVNAAFHFSFYNLNISHCLSTT